MSRELAKVFWENFKNYDFIVFVAALIQLLVFVYSMHRINELHRQMYPSDFAPSHERRDYRREKIYEPDIVRTLGKAIFSYTLYGNITGIFPLLGILGTVLSLIQMVGNAANYQGSFYLALTSTFWGLVFAILSKAADTFLSARLEEDESAVDLYLHRKDKDESDEEKTTDNH